ncbi:MAG: flippase-like domain-containing protein [Clostridia bacterium]|nr:flippase-like domain-containing protein [Clostridia bacterium]
MKDGKKIFRNLIFFILLIVVTFYVLLKDQDILQIVDILSSVKLQFVFAGMCCMAVYVVCEAINIGRTLKSLNEKSNIFRNIKYALIGFFFSGITPAASGGQPLQIYYMHKDKISVSNSTIALLMNLSSMQVITISFALISLIFNYHYLNGVLITFFIIGILLNLSALILLLIGIFSKRMTKGLINLAIKLMKVFKIKNIESKKEKMEKELGKYQENADYIKNNKVLIIKIILTTLVQFTFYYGVTYCTYRALGFNEHNVLEIVSMQSVLYATVSGIPSPGAVGVTEGAFIEIFKSVYPTSVMSTAVLLNRGINFYFLIIVSGVVTVINHIISSKREKTNEDK